MIQTCWKFVADIMLMLTYFSPDNSLSGMMLSIACLQTKQGKTTSICSGEN